MARVISLYRDGPGSMRPSAPARDERFFPIVEWVRANGELNNPLLVPIRFTQTRDEAEDVQRSLYNAARYYCSCIPDTGRRHCVRQHSNLNGGCPDGGQRISCQAKLVRVDGHVRVQFRFFDKKEAIREVVAKYGPDPSKWPYLAKAKRARE